MSIHVIATLAFLASLWIMAPIYQNRWFWALLTVITSQIMTSGFMYTQIRGVPYNAGGKWIAGGFQNQFGGEVPVVASVCKLILLSPHYLFMSSV
jgi:oligosaccharyltransferase complex subunit gamma